MSVAAIGLGSNLGDSVRTIQAAFEELRTLGVVTARSALYRTRAWGRRDQPDFVNAAALLETALAPHDLLRGLKSIEGRLGRTPGERWGPRSIDLDILAYGGLRVDDDELRIPHERLFERAFALLPLAEIDASFAAARDRLTPEQRAEVAVLSGPNAFAAMTWEEGLERLERIAAAAASAKVAMVRTEEPGFRAEVRCDAWSAPSGESLAAAVPHAHHNNGAAADGAAAERPVSILRSDLVGIVRLARPLAPAGSHVQTDQELAFVESLGIRTPVRAAEDGLVAEVYVEEGQAVDYGQALFAVRS